MAVFEVLVNNRAGTAQYGNIADIKPWVAIQVPPVEWGREELNPAKFCRIRITDAPDNLAAEGWLDEWEDPADLDVDGNPRWLGKRRLYFDPHRLRADERAEYELGLWVTTINRVRRAVRQR